MTSLINRYAREKSILKEKDDNLTGDDIREGLTAVISIKLGEPQFEGQTKTKLGNTEAKTFVQRVVTDQLGDWLDAQPDRGPRRHPQVDPGRRGPDGGAQGARGDPPQGPAGVRRHAGQAARLPVERPGRVRGLHRRGRLGRRLGGPRPQPARPRRSCPIRGKILNVERARLDKALGNNEVQALITAFGTGIGEDFDLAKLRYHKIVLMADADVDGQHICTLLLTLLFRYMRPLIENGYVYLAQPPLYRIKWSQRRRTTTSTPTASATPCSPPGRPPASGSPRTTGSSATRASARWTTRELWDTTMDPDHRTLLQVTLDDAAAADEIFSILMGEDVESRRSFIQRNAKDVRFLDIYRARPRAGTRAGRTDRMATRARTRRGRR